MKRTKEERPEQVFSRHKPPPFYKVKSLTKAQNRITERGTHQFARVKSSWQKHFSYRLGNCMAPLLAPYDE
jgi:hypothetical protein